MIELISEIELSAKKLHFAINSKKKIDDKFVCKINDNYKKLVKDVEKLKEIWNENNKKS